MSSEDAMTVVRGAMPKVGLGLLLPDRTEQQ